MTDKIIKFERSPFAVEVFLKENIEKFDNLPDWMRKFIAKLIEHGNISMAVQEAGVSKHTKEFQGSPQTVTQALYNLGIDGKEIANHIRQCLNATIIRGDGKGIQIEQQDYRTKLDTIKLVHKLIEGSGSDDPTTDGRKRDLIEMFKDE